MLNTSLNIKVPLEISIAQGICPTVAKAHIVLYNSQHIIRQEGGRVREREVAIR